MHRDPPELARNEYNVLDKSAHCVNVVRGGVPDIRHALVKRLRPWSAERSGAAAFKDVKRHNPPQRPALRFIVPEQAVK